MSKTHLYQLNIRWTGNTGNGTSGYRDYERSHTIRANGKPELLASSDTPFLGDATKYNPEDFLLASLSSCHMLWFLHLCADAGIIVTDYVDDPKGSMLQTDTGGGHFTEVVLHPIATITDAAMTDKANVLHAKAHEKCFIANSVNFPVRCEPVCKAAMRSFFTIVTIFMAVSCMGQSKNKAPRPSKAIMTFTNTMITDTLYVHTGDDEWATYKTYSFGFKNTGTDPLTVSYTGGCDPCFMSAYPGKPVKAGGEGVITISCGGLSEQRLREKGSKEVHLSKQWKINSNAKENDTLVVNQVFILRE